MSDYDNFVDLDYGQMRNDESRFGKGKRINRLKINPGEGKVVRFLRASSDPKFYIIRKQHWGIPVGVAKSPPLLCARAYNDSPCHFCDQVNEYFNSGDPRKQSLARRIKASASVMSNVIDVKNPHNDDGSPNIYLWQYSWKVFQDIMGYFKSPDYGDLTHPVTGRNFKIRCEEVSNQGDRTWTKYIVQVGANPTELEVPEALENLYDLDSAFPLKFYTYEEQKSIFDGSFDPRNQTVAPVLAGKEESKQLEEAVVDEGESFESEQFEESVDVESPVSGDEVAASSTEEDWGELVDSSDEDGDQKSDIMKKLDELKKVAKGS